MSGARAEGARVFFFFFEWTLARGGADVTRLHPAVALARIVTFKMLEDKALI